MKKVVSALLAVLMVASTFLCLFTGTAVAEDSTNKGEYYWPVPDASSTKATQNNCATVTGALDIRADYGKGIYATKSGEVLKVYSGCKNDRARGNDDLNIWPHSCTAESCNPSAGYGSLQQYTRTFKGTSCTFYTCNYGSGNGVILQHSDGTYSKYAHMLDSIVYILRLLWILNI